MLKYTNSIFDPYGFLGPMEVRARCFIRNLWQSKFDWDKSFESNTDLKEKWDNVKSEITKCLGIKVSREINIEPTSQIHIFSDASFDAFGSVAYIVTPSNGTNGDGTSQIIFAKCKLTKKIPKDESIPKLELDGLNLSTVLIGQVEKAYPHVKFARKILWSDSSNALIWCTKGSNPATYVHNRVAQISARAAGWEICHVSGKENPADWLTKPVKANKFMSESLWWEGPKWLKDPLNWDKDNPYSLNGEGTEPEFNKGDTSVMVGNVTPNELSPFWCVNTYKKTINALRRIC